MPDDGAAALERALDAPPPPGVVKALTPQQLASLAATIDGARRAQREALKRSAEAGLKQIPFPLRVALRKVLG